jgi:hypothetical protein
MELHLAIIMPGGLEKAFVVGIDDLYNLVRVIHLDFVGVANDEANDRTVFVWNEINDFAYLMCQGCPVLVFVRKEPLPVILM